MKIYTIENSYLSLGVAELGAEIVSLKEKMEQTEFIWQGDPKYWEDHAPLLFPAVGDWKKNQYEYKGTTYEMPLHGFARNQRFDIEVNGEEMICTLKSNVQTEKYYPFPFLLTVVYSLKKNILHVEQYIQNLGEEKMPYSIGEHVGFRVPLYENETYRDYYVQLDHKETACRYPLRDDGMIGPAVPCLQGEDKIRLTEDMFAEGAWNFAGLRSERVSLKNDRNQCQVIMDFPGFSHFSLWSVPGAPYLCIEPCNGVTSSPEEGEDPFLKRGIHILDPGQEETAVYSITVETKKIREKLQEEFTDSIIERRVSVRKFSRRVVTRETAEAVLRHAMTAPSAGNNREWEFYVVEKEEDKRQISQMSPYAAPARKAALLIIPCMNRDKMRADNQGNEWWVQDMASCAQTILLGAKEEGLDGVWMGFYPDEGRVRKLTEYLGCAETLLPFAVIALGYAEGEAGKKERADMGLVHYL